MTSVTPRDVLLLAADLLSEREWCQGAARRGDALCAEGAIWLAVTGTLPDGEFVEPPGGVLPQDYTTACVAVVGHLNQVGRRGLHLWNDEPGRTKAEVVAVLREAAGSPTEKAASV